MSQNIIAADKRQVLCVSTTLPNRLSKVNKNQNHHKKNGHQIAHAWWAEFNGRVEQASGYLVDSKIKEAFHSTPFDQRDAFLESIGGYFVVNATSGCPASHLLIGNEEIELQKMPPAEQDAHFEKMERRND